MKVCFITYGDINVASSRMRAFWVAPYMKDAYCVTFDEFTRNFDAHSDADVYIWQKVSNLKLITLLPKARHYWDVCDPSWWWQPDLSKDVVNSVNGIVASSKGLADDFNNWCGESATVIPDRLELSHFPLKREHEDVSPVRFIWFGHHVNRFVLFGALANLERLTANGYKIELTVMDDRPNWPFFAQASFPVNMVKWSLEKENEIIASHDIALLPDYPGAWGRVKSDNKYRTANACAVPAIFGWEYGDLLDMVARPAIRNELTRLYKYGELFHVRDSARDWEALLS